MLGNSYVQRNPKCSVRADKQMVLMRGRNQAGDVTKVLKKNTTTNKMYLIIMRYVKSFIVTSFMNGKTFLDYLRKA